MIITPLQYKREGFSMSEIVMRAAMYMAGHGSKTRPRLIELQHRRIVRYYRAFLRQQGKSHHRAPEPFIDLRLPSFGMGKVDLDDVPAFRRLYTAVQDHQFEVVYLDLDETHPALTPDYESAFVRYLLEGSGVA